DKIAPYLPALMERMLSTLTSPGIPRTKELAVSAIGAIAQAAKESLLPYFQAIMEHLTSYMLTTREDLRPVQIQSIETMAILANVLDKDIFQPLSEKCCQLGLDLCDRVDDPDLRRCTYSLFGSLANVMGDSISTYLPRITTLLIYSLKSTEGIKPSQRLHHPPPLRKPYSPVEVILLPKDKIAPYLPALMERMLSTLTSPGIPRTKELAVSAIGAIAQAAKESLLPYFQAIMEHLTSYMLTTREDLRPVQIQSIETMAILANVLDKDIFQPLSEKCCQLGLDLCDRVDDPDLRRCTYSLFGSLANVMGDSISPYLPRITTLLIYSLKSTEGIKAPLDSGNSFLLFEDEEEEAEVEGEETLTDEEEEEDSDPLGMCVRSAFMDEKEDACIALGEIAASVSVPFLPYIETSFQEVSQLLPCPHIRVRKAAFEALGQFIVSLHRVCQQEPSETHAVACQDNEEEEDDDDDDEAEYDSMLIEYAGEMIPILAEATGGDTFAPYFAGFLPLLINKMKASSSTADKSFAVGIIAETVQGLGGASSSFVPHLLPLLMGAARDEDQEVRSNAVFGLGVLTEHGKEAMYEHYPKILALLSNLIAQERNNRVTDNVCGAVARMLMTNPGGMPVEQVFPVLLRALPLREDFEEYKTVYRCVAFIYQNDPSQVLQQIPEIVRSSGPVLGCKNLPTEARNLLLTLLGSLSARCPAEFQTALLTNPPEVCTSIQAAIGSA
ncbi:importin-4-like, partial [Protobothrops mucrosquamatus]|uniref:importin-4-like n=1 Tax=Protobothrops mucrosquamatus TaxID=103944 RepID=UPI0010FB9897